MHDMEPKCTVIARGETYHGKQDLDYLTGLCAETVGSKALCLHVVTIPPGGRARRHLHQSHESAVYVLSGEAGMWYGEGLRQHVWAHPGDFVYIPANMPHLPYNPSATDPNEQESVTVLDIPDPGVAPR